MTAPHYTNLPAGAFFAVFFGGGAFSSSSSVLPFALFPSGTPSLCVLSYPSPGRRPTCPARPAVSHLERVYMHHTLPGIAKDRTRAHPGTRAVARACMFGGLRGTPPLLAATARSFLYDLHGARRVGIAMIRLNRVMSDWAYSVTASAGAPSRPARPIS